MFNIEIIGRNSRKIAFRNMSQYDANKIAGRLNRLNKEAAKMLGKTFAIIYKVVRNG